MNRSSRSFLPALIAGSLAAVPVAQAANVFDSEALSTAVNERRDGATYEAINALYRMLQEVPNAGRVKLELAVAYMQAGFFGEAERLANEVKDDEDTPEQVQENIDAFLELVGERRSETEEGGGWSVELGAFAGHDSNVNYGPENDIVDQGIVVPPAFRERSDTFLAAKVTVNHVARGDETEYFGRPSMWSLETQAYIYRKSYSDENDFDTQVVSFGTGPVLRVSNGMQFGLKYRVDHISLDEDKLAMYFGLFPSARFLLGPAGYLNLGAMYQYRDYGNNSSNGLEGRRRGGSIAYTTPRFFSTQLTVGYFDYTQTAEASNLEHDADGYWANVTVRPNLQWKLYAEYRQKDADYEGIEPIIGQARQIEEDRIRAGVEYGFKKALFGLHYTDIQTESNGQAFEYERQEWTASASLRFD